uniref:Glutathione synthetase n=1 Tax=Globodera pallida TaxID=36090 RepID=A0A183CPR3_GLOPA
MAKCVHNAFESWTQNSFDDAPGILDTGGIKEDDLNLHKTLSFISTLPELHAICILLRPNSTRTGPAFQDGWHWLHAKAEQKREDSSKKIQQLLATPGTLERFFPSATEADNVAAIRETFAGLWGLEKSDEQTERVIKNAIENPRNYVLKPNGECGGNNFYDEAVVVGELGVYGTLLGNMHNQSVWHNVQSGHLLRTKLEEVNEGGISVGTGVGDSPYQLK